MSMTDPVNDNSRNESKTINNDVRDLVKINLMQQVTSNVFKPIADVIASEQTLIDEYQKVKGKTSNLSRSKRDLVIMFVEQWLPLMEKMITEENNQKKEDVEQTEQAVVEK